MEEVSSGYAMIDLSLYQQGRKKCAKRMLRGVGEGIFPPLELPVA